MLALSIKQYASLIFKYTSQAVYLKLAVVCSSDDLDLSNIVIPILGYGQLKHHKCSCEAGQLALSKQILYADSDCL